LVHLFLELFWVGQIVVLKGSNAFIELVDEGYRCWDVEIDNVFLRDVIKVFDNSAYRVSVRDDEHIFAFKYLRADSIVPERYHTLHAISKTFCARQAIARDLGVARVIPGHSLIVFFEDGWRDIVGAAPDLDLLLAVLGSSFALVEALQAAIVALIEAPVLVHGEVVAAHFVSSVVVRLDSARQHGSEYNIEFEVIL